MIPFIDIHTHKKASVSNQIAIINTMLHEAGSNELNSVSAGWHPWHLAGHQPDEMFTRLKLKAQSDEVLAIGECGIDRTIDYPMEKQVGIFTIHIDIAEKYRKPVIVHCVKAYSDLLHVLKNRKPKVPLILHGYNGNLQQTQQLLKHNVFFSFGELLFKPRRQTVQVLNEIPMKQIFLESDESAISIEKIYLRAAEILACSMSALKKQIYENYISIF
ncbi:TatD family hydrolase [Roseimarinus sediminis]|jgi:TatD DNase family protein|uniref:TatD family hydrolase n=1 Tax=Roseimarinus sediminis TaxID=1610899 RepID=UPI003D19BA05